MKLMICANLGVGALPAIDLPAAKIAQWQKDRAHTLSKALEDAIGRGAEACVVAGGLFARDSIAQSLISATMGAADGCDIPIYYLPFPVSWQVSG